jgi:hypothetical protein
LRSVRRDVEGSGGTIRGRRGRRFMSIPKVESLDELNIELEAMQTIARAGRRPRSGNAPAHPSVDQRALRQSACVGCVETGRGRSAACERSEPERRRRPSVRRQRHRRHAGARAGAPAGKQAAPTNDQPLDSLVRGFATEIRALGVQWHGA